MTVLHVRLLATHAEVMFAESARIYRLPRSNVAFEALVARLRHMAGTGQRVTVQFDAPNGEIIEGLR